ncbi:MAG TPA: redoxin domain-containing protein [Bryobacteraceae bacterium]|nr:redoxin domain-containing protein [Bryobacteraceae bacterium]
MQRLGVLVVLGWGALSAAAPVRFELLDTNGTIHTAQEWRAKRAVVLFFTMTDCPLANGYVPEMNRLRASYGPQGVAFYGVQSDNTASDAAVRKYVQEFQYSFPMLNDPRLTLARLTGAKVTPEVAVLSAAGEVLYLGRIDNKVEDLTRPRYAATEPELRNALDAVLAGKAPKESRTRAVGCSINLETK